MINTEKYLMPRNKANKKCLRYLQRKLEHFVERN